MLKINPSVRHVKWGGVKLARRKRIVMVMLQEEVAASLWYSYVLALSQAVIQRETAIQSRLSCFPWHKAQLGF